MLDDNRIVGCCGTLFLVAADGQGAILMQVDLVIQSNLNCSILDRSLDIAIALLRRFIIRTIATDLQRGVEFLGNSRIHIITGELQTVIHGSDFIGVVAALVLDARSLLDGRFFTFLVFDDCLDILAIIQRSCIEVRRNVDGDAILTRRAVSTFRTGQADMADAAFAGNRDSIFAVRSGNADFAVSSVSAVRASDGNAVCAILAGDEEAVFAIFARLAIMADDNGGAALGFDSDFTVLAVFASNTRLALLADSQLVVELDVVGHLAIVILSGNEQVALVGTSIVAKCTRASFSLCLIITILVINRNDCMLTSRSCSTIDSIADFLELVFGGCTAADIGRAGDIPVLVVKARDVVASLAFLGRSRLAILVDSNHIEGLIVKMLDDNRIIHRFRTILRVAADGQGTILLQVDIFIQSDLNRSGICISRNLNVAIFFCLLRSLVITTVAANLQGFVELLGDRRSRTIIAGVLHTIVKGSDELDRTLQIVAIFQTIELFRSIRIQIGIAITDSVVNICMFLACAVIQGNVATSILADAKNHLTLLIGLSGFRICFSYLDDRNSLTINFDRFSYIISFRRFRRLPELIYVIDSNASALLGLFLAKNYVFIQFQVINLSAIIRCHIGQNIAISVCSAHIISVYRYYSFCRDLHGFCRNVMGLALNCLQLGHVDCICIFFPSCYVNNLTSYIL